MSDKEFPFNKKETLQVFNQGLHRKKRVGRGF